MPPRSRKGKGGAATASSQAQSTLSFNNKSARVTKPGNRQDVAASKLSELAQAQIEEEVTAPEEEEEGTTEIVEVTTITPEPEVQLPSIQKSETKRQKRDADKDERELAAERITDAQLKKYWQAEEASRLAPRGTYLLSPLRLPLSSFPRS
jgi:DNA polymerase delta subunit 4